jgi:hypothetical protein
VSIPQQISFRTGTLTKVKGSPPKLGRADRQSREEQTIHDQVDVSQAVSSQKSPKSSKGLLTKILAFGMMATALAGCLSPGPGNATVAQQLTEPTVIEKVQPVNPFELMRMEDGSVAVSADLENDDAYVLASAAAIRQDGGVDVVQRTEEGSTLCEQATALGGTCLNEEQVVVSDPSGPLLIETFAREGEAIHRLEAKPSDGVSQGGVELNKLPAGTEVFSENGSGLLTHDGNLQQYPGY